MTSALFSPLTVGNLAFHNRIAIAPMCQYSADDGSATDWHIQHWMTLGMSGAAMVTVEMTDVERRGRISHGCMGLYSDDNELSARRALDAARRHAAPGTLFGIQLAHAGRKASCRLPWQGGGPLQKDEDPWETVSASALPFHPDWHVPRALDGREVEAVIGKFAEAAGRASRAGFDFIEIHAAHGYLINQFASPLSNRRTDRWGGSPENRLRFAREVTRAVAAAAPGLMVGARISVTEWADGGMTVADGIALAAALKEEGAAYICCSSGGNAHQQKLPSGPGYQVHLSEEVRKAVGIPTRAVGLITQPRQAEAVIAEDRADFVALGRALLADPRWPWRAAATLGEPIRSAPQYARAFGTMEHWVNPR